MVTSKEKSQGDTMEQAKEEAENFFNELSNPNAVVETANKGEVSIQPLETSKDEPQVEKPVQEPVQEEVQEPVQEPVNLNHLVNEDGSIKMEATDDQMKKLGVDNPASYRYFQSQLDRTRAQDAREKEEMKREIESLRVQSTPQIKEEVLAPPQKPTTNDPVDKIEYLEKLAEYQSKVIDKVSTNFQAEQQKRQQVEQEAQQKAYITGQLVSAGASPERAGEIINKLASLQRDPQAYARFIVQATEGLFNQPSMQNQQKVNAIGNRVQQQGQALPLGVVPSSVEKPKKADFFDDLNQWTRKNY